MTASSYTASPKVRARALSFADRKAREADRRMQAEWIAIPLALIQGLIALFGLRCHEIRLGFRTTKRELRIATNPRSPAGVRD